MTVPTDVDDVTWGTGSLWMIVSCFFFLTLLGLICYGSCFGVPLLLRYCSWNPCCNSGHCCFLCDVQAQRRERESLRQARDLRTMQHMRSSSQSQILRDQVMRELQRASAPGAEGGNTIDFTHNNNEMHRFGNSEGNPILAWQEMNNMGFLVVPPRQMVTPVLPQLDHPSLIPSARDRMASMTPQERRAILEQILQFKEYDIEQAEKYERTNTNGTDKINKNKEGTIANIHDSAYDCNSKLDPIKPKKNVLKVQPDSLLPPDTTCAICFDEFEDGELLNVSKRCSHLFHKECLLLWLDRHDVCPCCRKVMVPSGALRSAVTRFRRSEDANSRETTSSPTSECNNSAVIPPTEVLFTSRGGVAERSLESRQPCINITSPTRHHVSLSILSEDNIQEGAVQEREQGSSYDDIELGSVESTSGAPVDFEENNPTLDQEEGTTATTTSV